MNLIGCNNNLRDGWHFCGMWLCCVGSISQTLTYPFDVIRRKMQVTGMGSLGYQYNGALDALQSIIRTEGVGGLYRGLWPNLRKWRFPFCKRRSI